jgi:hypothetical protein
MNGRSSRAEVAKLLSASLGIEKARECVVAAAIALELGEDFPREDALRVLEQLAAQGGIVGVTARFAKSRVHLIWSLA